MIDGYAFAASSDFDPLNEVPTPPKGSAAGGRETSVNGTGPSPAPTVAGRRTCPACILMTVLSVFLTIGASGCKIEGFGPQETENLERVMCLVIGADWECEYLGANSDCNCEFRGSASKSMVGAGSALYVGASAHVAGSNGTNWRSDAEIHNLGGEAAVVTIQLLDHAADNSNPSSTAVNIGPGQSLRLGDVLASRFGVSGKAALRFFTDTSTVFVTTRTYNLLGEGNPLGLPSGSTFGQYIPALDTSSAIRFGEEGRLIQLSQDPPEQGFRSNLILVSASTSAITVEADLFTAGGFLLGTLRFDLDPYEYLQTDKVFERVTDDAVADGYAVVRTTTPDGAVFALASVVDNLTGDPVALTATPVRPGAGADSSPLYLVASAHVAGSAGTNWRSDVEVHNRGEAVVTYTIELLKHGLDNTSPRMQTFTLQPGRSARFVDVLAEVFDFSGKAALRITPTSGTILVSSRTYNLLGDGNPLGLPAGATFGQNILVRSLTRRRSRPGKI